MFGELRLALCQIYVYFQVGISTSYINLSTCKAIIYFHLKKNYK